MGAGYRRVGVVVGVGVGVGVGVEVGYSTVREGRVGYGRGRVG